MADSDAQLLSQIEHLVNQYLALGPNTPLYDQFQQLLPDLQSGVKEESAESPQEEAAEGGDNEYGGGHKPPPSGLANLRAAREKAGEDMKSGKIQPKGRHAGNAEVLQAAMKKRRQDQPTKA